MATVQSGIKNFCDSLYKELFHMKIKLGKFASIIEQGKGKNTQELLPYVRHLREIDSFIDWKVEILNKVSPVEWSKFGQDIEGEVSVPPIDLTDTDQPSGGFIGG
ncbi:MAG: hypothetical protein ACXADW_19720 [Candidatus Hodarchaeales archaeon]